VTQRTAIARHCNHDTSSRRCRPRRWKKVAVPRVPLDMYVVLLMLALPLALALVWAFVFALNK